MHPHIRPLLLQPLLIITLVLIRLPSAESFGTPADELATLGASLGRAVTPETNAAVLIARAAEDLPNAEYFAASRRLDASNLEAALDRVRCSPWSAADHPYLAEWLEASEQPLALVVEATSRPAWFETPRPPTATSAVGPGFSGLVPTALRGRDAAALLAARATRHIGEGRPDDAWHDIRATHRLGRLVGTGGTLAEARIGANIEHVAIDAGLTFARECRVPGARLRECLTDLDAVPPRRPLADIVALGERALYRATVRQAARSPNSQEAAIGELGRAALLGTFDDGSNEVVDALRKNDRAALPKWLRLCSCRIGPALPIPRAWLSGTEDGQELGVLLANRLSQSAERTWDAREQADRRETALRVAFALALHRAEHGAYPDSLSELVPAYLPAVPLGMTYRRDAEDDTYRLADDLLKASDPDEPPID